MNPGQQKFHDFLMSLVQPGSESAAETILTQAFGQQAAGPLDPSAIDGFVAQLTPLVKPESVPELQQAAERMKEMAAHGPGDHGPGDHEHGDHPHGDHPHGDHPHGPDDGEHHHWGGPQSGAGPAASAPPATPAS